MRVGLRVFMTVALSLSSITTGETASSRSAPLEAESGGRFLVIACSESKTKLGITTAHRKVRALRSARFKRAHVVDGGEIPKVGDYWICLVDSFGELEPASDLAARTRGAGFKDAYVAPGW